MNTMNRLWNARNPHQGMFKKVLCVCSAGLLRSPTLAWVLSNDPYKFNTRAVGVRQDYALIPLEEVHLQWADIIIAVNEDILHEINNTFRSECWEHAPLYALELPDIYGYRDPILVNLIKQQLSEIKELSR